MRAVKEKIRYIQKSQYTSKHQFVMNEFGKSKTIPGQSYTVKELVQMNRKGISPDVLKRALFEMDDFGEELNPLRAKNFDLTDMDAVIMTVKRHQDKVEAENKKQKIKDREIERQKIVQEYLEEVDKNKDGKHDKSENTGTELPEESNELREGQKEAI